MCNAVNFDGQWYQTPRQLARIVGGVDRLRWQKDVKQELDSCLCSIDLPGTLSASGHGWTRGADPMEWFVYELTRSTANK